MCENSAHTMNRTYMLGYMLLVCEHCTICSRFSHFLYASRHAHSLVSFIRITSCTSSSCYDCGGIRVELHENHVALSSNSFRKSHFPTRIRENCESLSANLSHETNEINRKFAQTGVLVVLRFPTITWSCVKENYQHRKARRAYTSNETKILYPTTQFYFNNRRESTF